MLFDGFMLTCVADACQECTSCSSTKNAWSIGCSLDCKLTSMYAMDMTLHGVAMVAWCLLLLVACTAHMSTIGLQSESACCSHSCLPIYSQADCPKSQFREKACHFEPVNHNCSHALSKHMWNYDLFWRSAKGLPDQAVDVTISVPHTSELRKHIPQLLAHQQQWQDMGQKILL